MFIRQKSRQSRVALAAAFCVMALNASAEESVELTPGVIVDLEEGQLYLMSPQQAVEAVSVDTGDTLWTSTKAAKPLAKRGNRLVSQAELAEAPNVLNLVVLDTAQQGEALSTSSVPLPPEVMATIDDSLTAKFSSRAVAMNQEAFVSWEYQAIPRQGMLMMPDEENGGQETLSPQMPPPTRSTIKLDLPTGEATTIESQQVPQEAAQAFLPAGVTAAPADPRTWLSADGRHTLRYERIADDREWNKYQWTIVDNESGDEIGKLRSHLSQTTFLIVDSDTIVFETGAYLRRTESDMENVPRSIRAVDLDTGEEQWSRPLRDTEYRGPFPP